MGSSHEVIDKKNLAMHRLVAEKIRRDPRLLETVRAILVRWRTTTSAASLPYLDQWSTLLDQGLEAALSVATEDSEKATALRQASPFPGILTNEERLKFLSDWKRERGK